MADKSKRLFLKASGTTLAAFTVADLARGVNNPAFKQILSSVDSLKPKKLVKGSTIAITSPAGAIWDEELVPEFCKILSSLGFKTVLGKTLSQKFGYLAGQDELRAAELNSFFADKSIDAIFTAKGGWGCARILDKLDYDLIAKNPKIIMGFSDITCLLNAIYAKTGMLTFHGPVGNSSWGEFSMRYVKEVLIEGKQTEFASTGFEKDKHTVLTSGKSKGILVGGNLSVLAAMLGSNYLPDWNNKILFLEETGEEPYRLDRMLVQLKLNGVLDKLSGFVFGKCVKCDAEEPEKAFTFMQVLEQHIKPLNIPAFYGGMIGHIENKWTLPVGGLVEMDANRGVLKLMEAAVI